MEVRQRAHIFDIFNKCVIDEKNENEFGVLLSLPEQWCIKVKVQKNVYWPYSVYEWRSNIMNEHGWSVDWAADGYLNHNGRWSASQPRDDKTERYLIELTLEQFEKFVLKRKFRLWKLKK